MKRHKNVTLITHASIWTPISCVNMLTANVTLTEWWAASKDLASFSPLSFLRKPQLRPLRCCFGIDAENYKILSVTKKHHWISWQSTLNCFTLNSFVIESAAISRWFKHIILVYLVLSSLVVCYYFKTHKHCNHDKPNCDKRFCPFPFTVLTGGLHSLQTRGFFWPWTYYIISLTASEAPLLSSHQSAVKHL